MCSQIHTVAIASLPSQWLSSLVIINIFFSMFLIFEINSIHIYSVSFIPFNWIEENFVQNLCVLSSQLVVFVVGKAFLYAFISISISIFPMENIFKQLLLADVNCKRESLRNLIWRTVLDPGLSSWRWNKALSKFTLFCRENNDDDTYDCKDWHVVVLFFPHILSCQLWRFRVILSKVWFRYFASLQVFHILLCFYCIFHVFICSFR